MLIDLLIDWSTEWLIYWFDWVSEWEWSVDGLIDWLTRVIEGAWSTAKGGVQDRSVGSQRPGRRRTFRVPAAWAAGGRRSLAWTGRPTADLHIWPEPWRHAQPLRGALRQQRTSVITAPPHLLWRIKLLLLLLNMHWFRWHLTFKNVAVHWDPSLLSQ